MGPSTVAIRIRTVGMMKSWFWMEIECSVGHAHTKHKTSLPKSTSLSEWDEEWKRANPLPPPVIPSTGLATVGSIRRKIVSVQLIACHINLNLRQIGVMYFRLPRAHTHTFTHNEHGYIDNISFSVDVATTIVSDPKKIELCALPAPDCDFNLIYFLAMSRFLCFGQQFARLSIIQMHINCVCGFNKHIDGCIIEMGQHKRSA